jgi:hypothetical protein
MVIGFSGGMGVGKSTAVETLRESQIKPWGVTVKLIKFAQPLYDMQEFIYDRISGVYTRPETFIKDRKLLQWLGTDWGRESISKSLWMDVWKADVELALAKGFTVVADDVRFDNEAQAIKDLGGKVILITSTKASERINTGAGIQNHASEAGISKNLIDKHITNDADYQSYVETLEATFKSLGIK